MAESNRNARIAAGVGTGLVVGGAGSAAVGYATWKVGGYAATGLTRAAPQLAVRLIPGLSTLATVAAIGGLAYSAFQVGSAIAQEVRRPKPEPQPKPQPRPKDRATGEPLDRPRDEHAAVRAENRSGEPATLPSPSASAAPAKPASSYDERRAALDREAETVRRAVEIETASRGGYGPKAQAAQTRLKEIQAERAKVDAEERNNDPFRLGLQIGLPIGSAVAGLGLGHLLGKMGVNAAAAEGAKLAGQVDKLGGRAAKILASSPNGVIAGTTAGDRGKAVVNEAYRIGGAPAAFASPGYASPPPNAGALFGTPLGLPGRVNYVIPAANMAIGGAALGGSFVVEDPTARMTMRSAGAADFMMGFGQYKALTSAMGVRPDAGAVSAIEGLRNRITRETATRAPAGVAQARAGANLAIAKEAGRRAAGTARLRTDAAIGVEAARGKGRVAAAAITSKQGAVKAAAEKRYKDTWQDSRGRVYHRKDKSVRKAANANPPPPPAPIPTSSMRARPPRQP